MKTCTIDIGLGCSYSRFSKCSAVGYECFYDGYCYQLPRDSRNERIAQLTAHRACCGSEHDPATGKLHGYCVVCGVPWPCEITKER